MARIVKGRQTVVFEGDFVVFMIGMRVNKPWKVWKWFSVARAMRSMLDELSSDPESGLLGYRQLFGNPFAPEIVQYWRSFEHLERFARAKDRTHHPAWVRFNKAIGTSGDVGIWHETYLVRAGEYEVLYNGMPPHGLGKAGKLVPASGNYRSAAGRLGRPTGNGSAPAEAAADAVSR